MPFSTSTAAQSLNHVLLVCNPTAGSRDRTDELADLQRQIEARGLIVELVTNLETLAPLALSLQSAGRLRAVVACGGDGTVAEVVNRVGDQAPVTVYPMGTANLLAGYLGIPRDVLAMSNLLAEDGVVVRLDAGRANGRIFLLMVSCGFDAEVVRRMHSRRRGRHISYLSWAQPILAAMRSYKYPSLRVACTPPSGGPATIQRTRWVFAVNLPVYAAGLVVAPQARADDGQFDICTFDRGSLLHAFKYIGHVLFGRHQRLSDYKSQIATHVHIDADEPVPYQLDGDPGGILPLEIEILPGRLVLLVPSMAARRHRLPMVPRHREGALPR